MITDIFHLTFFSIYSKHSSLKVIIGPHHHHHSCTSPMNHHHYTPRTMSIFKTHHHCHHHLHQNHLFYSYTINPSSNHYYSRHGTIHTTPPAPPHYHHINTITITTTPPSLQITTHIPASQIDPSQRYTVSSLPTAPKTASQCLVSAAHELPTKLKIPMKSWSESLVEVENPPAGGVPSPGGRPTSPNLRPFFLSALIYLKCGPRSQVATVRAPCSWARLTEAARGFVCNSYFPISFRYFVSRAL